MKLILGSRSPSRKRIMDSVGFEYTVVTSKEDEVSKAKNPCEYTKELSKIKALSVERQLKEDSLIICADTIMYSGNKLYEKPQTVEEAKENLMEMRGKTIQSITGVTINDMYQKKIISFNEITLMHIRKCLESDIDWYIENEADMFLYSGFVVEGKGKIFVEKYEGDYFNILGLPISRTIHELNNLGYELFDLPIKRDRFKKQ